MLSRAKHPVNVHTLVFYSIARIEQAGKVQVIHIIAQPTIDNCVPSEMDAKVVGAPPLSEPKSSAKV